jgi:hypothetical protein
MQVEAEAGYNELNNVWERIWVLQDQLREAQTEEEFNDIVEKL